MPRNDKELDAKIAAVVERQRKERLASRLASKQQELERAEVKLLQALKRAAAESYEARRNTELAHARTWQARVDIAREAVRACQAAYNELHQPQGTTE